jgi:hypothetical protein
MMGNATTPPPPRNGNKIMSFASQPATHDAVQEESKRLGITVSQFVNDAVKSKIDWTKISQAASFPPMITNLEVTPVVLDPGTFKPRRGVKVAFDWEQLQDWMQNSPDGELASYVGRQIVNAIQGKLPEDQPQPSWPQFEKAVRNIDQPWEQSKHE